MKTEASSLVGVLGMDLLQTVRNQVVQQLWNIFSANCPEVKIVRENLNQLHLDHLAIIDLPGPHTGRGILGKIFESIGFQKAGEGYLPEKQNSFDWYSEENVYEKPVHQALPQVVLADFNLSETSLTSRLIIQKYARSALATEIRNIEHLAHRVRGGEKDSIAPLVKLVVQSCTKIKYQVPTRVDIQSLLHENELAAWTLMFGRTINHFGVSVHLMNGQNSLSDFLGSIRSYPLQISQNGGGQIKGSMNSGLEQATTLNEMRLFVLRDGIISLPNCYLEFVWRYKSGPGELWRDYHTDFVPMQSNKIVEALHRSTLG